jgi:hypothetical protein
MLRTFDVKESMFMHPFYLYTSKRIERIERIESLIIVAVTRHDSDVTDFELWV